ncbi:MAG: MBL fold metallo-hydrolase [Candidatus Cloacimonetes bacterium]|nr:MBL fold metallo-hydrolase [Candidatus Cloacimonadota bacterium]
MNRNTKLNIKNNDTRFLIEILLCFIALSFCSCGFNNALLDAPIGTEPGYIKNLKLENNRLTFTTEDSTYVHLNYKNRINNTDQYKAWSAGKAKLSHQYHLPVSAESIDYQISLSVTTINNTTVADTTFTFHSTLQNHPFLKVHFINVQQGDAILIETPEGKNLQIDGGYGTLRDREWQGGGEALALHYLQAQNISHLDYIIETHRHEDHWGGLQDITSSSITHDKYLSPTDRHGYRSGSFLTLESQVSFQILNIGYDPSYSENNRNNESIVLKAKYYDAEFLFTGDAEGEVQEWIYDRGFDLSADVLKVAHHGANSNSTTDSIYLQTVFDKYAKIAILTYGKNNPYGHPRALNRFTNIFTYGQNPVQSTPAGSNYTFDCGNILVLSDGQMVFVTTEK